MGFDLLGAAAAVSAFHQAGFRPGLMASGQSLRYQANKANDEGQRP
jgi:hypothetical protein